jgi:hypothetical protein
MRSLGIDGESVPEESETGDPLQSGEMFQAVIGDRSVEHQVGVIVAKTHERVPRRAAGPLRKRRKALEERHRGIGKAQAGCHSPQRALGGQRVDNAIAKVRTNEIDFFELVAERQVCHAAVREVAVPIEFERFERRQTAQHVEPFVRDAGIAQVQVFELSKRRETSQPRVGETLRVGSVEVRDVIERG